MSAGSDGQVSAGAQDGGLKQRTAGHLSALTGVRLRLPRPMGTSVAGLWTWAGEEAGDAPGTVVYRLRGEP